MQGRRIKEEPPKGEAPVETAESRTVLTSNEAAIAARVLAERDDWKSVKESDIGDFKMADDPFALPGPAKEMKAEKQFAFRWISRTPERMDEMRTKDIPFKWWVCNEVNTPFLKGHFDPVLGCVSKLDQMLVFKPYWMYEKEQAFKTRTDRELHKGDYLKAKHGEKVGGGEFVEGNKIGGKDTVFDFDPEKEVEARTGIKPEGEGFSEEE